MFIRNCHREFPAKIDLDSRHNTVWSKGGEMDEPRDNKWENVTPESDTMM